MQFVDADVAVNARLPSFQGGVNGMTPPARVSLNGEPTGASLTFTAIVGAGSELSGLAV